jgi:hypothetical protein
VPADAPTAFFSYSREDLEFALRVAKDLKNAGANVWMDKLDIRPGQSWERRIDEALNACQRVLVILSPSSVDSDNVMGEVTVALDERKEIIPVLYRDCTIPFFLRPLNHVDFRTDYAQGLDELLDTLGVEQAASRAAAASTVPEASQSAAPHTQKSQVAADQAGLEQKERERLAAAERLRVEQEREQKAALEKARLEQEERERLAALAAVEQARRKKQERESLAAAEKRRVEQSESRRVEEERSRGARFVSDIFISYASKDRPRVKPLAEALQQKGWSVWWDPTIRAGARWDREIEAALRGAKCVIVLWSRLSVERDWVRNEAREGKERDILVPALLDSVPIPLEFKGLQAANLIGWSGELPSNQFEELARAVSEVLSSAKTAPSDVRPPRRRKQPTKFSP